MSDGIRRLAAVLILIAGAALLWLAGPHSHDAEAAKNDLDSTVAYAREHAASSDPRLKGAYSFERGGWVYVHLEGDPATIGFQHGYMLAKEIQDAFPAVQAGMVHSTQRDWAFFPPSRPRNALAQNRSRISAGTPGHRGRPERAHRFRSSTSTTSWPSIPSKKFPTITFLGSTKKKNSRALPISKSPGNCSAFVATGSWTKDGQIVIAHNNWTSYMNGERWRIIFDIQPAHGYRILMDGFPGVIASDDDFGINSRWPHGHRNHHHAIRRLGSQRQARVLPRAQGPSVRRFHR